MTSDLRHLLLTAKAAQDAGDLEAALRGLERASAQHPDDHRIHTNCANLLWLSGNAEAAVRRFQRALSLFPNSALSLRGLGNALRDLNAFEDADAAYSDSRYIDDNALTAWNHSQLLVGLERYEEAYELSERRLELSALATYRPGMGATSHPSLQGKASSTPLHIWSEQGYGDSLQYLRWIPALCCRPNAVVMEVERPLTALLQQGLAWLPHPPVINAKEESGIAAAAAPVGDHCSLLSLPHRLGGAPRSMPRPYLRSEAWPTATGRSLIPRIGLLWAAGRKLDEDFTSREYRSRSLTPDALQALTQRLHGMGAELMNLQIGPDRAMASAIPEAFQAALPPNADFSQTAAVVRQLDLVITVDTAMAHLAGALGHPTWVLLPAAADPRWLRNRSDSPWYPSLRLWRQIHPGDWNSVIEAMMQELPQWWRQQRRFSAPI